MGVKSTFASGAYLMGRLFLFVSVMLLFFFILTFINLSPSSIAMLLPISIFSFAWIVLFRGDMRKKAIKVGIDGDKISVSRYFGLGPTKTYDLTSFDGYITTVIPAKTASYEHLYLTSDKKNVIILSEFYHKNYDELKFFLDGAVPFLGHQEFKPPRNLREMLRS
jgi:hypothetical protein